MAEGNKKEFFTEISTDDSFCEAEELFGMPGITELEDDVFPSDYIPVLAAAFNDYDGDDEDAAPAEWQPATVTALRPYRPDVSPISPASPIAIPPANFLMEAPSSTFVPPAVPFYSSEQQMEASGGAAVGSFLHYDQRDLVNGTRVLLTYVVCLSVSVCLSACRARMRR